MAKVTIEKRCEGPFHWETKDGERTIAPLGSCGENLQIEYDDEDPIASQWAVVWQKLGHKWACVPCSKSGNSMMHAREYRRQKAIDAEFGKKNRFKSDKGKEYLF